MERVSAEESIPTTTSRFLKEWREVESGYYEYILDDEPAPKPRVVLPTVTKGIINTSAVQQLQDRLEKAEAELNRLKEKSLRDEVARKQLSDPDIRELLKSNPVAISIFKFNLNKQLEIERAKFTTTLTAEREGKTGSSKDTTKLSTSLSAGNQSALRLSVTEDQLKRANAKLSIVEKAVETRPNTTVQDIWEEVEQWTPMILSKSATSGFPAPSNNPVSFGTGFSQLTMPFGYPITALGSALKVTSPVIFGQVSKPQSTLGVMTGAFSSPGLQPNLSTAPKVEPETKIRSGCPPSGKRGREATDVGGSDTGPKKICKESKE